MSKLLLIDGPNLCFREFFSRKNLSYKGRNVDVIYGVLRSLIALHKEWPDHLRIIAWEGGYQRRLTESESATSLGIVPHSYKHVRREKAKEPNPELESLFEQMDIIKEILRSTKTLQVRVKGSEADDVIYSYAMQTVKDGGEAVIVSSDKDFYQCLCPQIKVWNARDEEMWTEERFKLEFGYSPTLWNDKGALEGEVGDSIVGVDGWGPVTATKYICEHGSLDCILKAVEAKAKKSKKEETLLKQVERLRLARSLKQMDSIPVPQIVMPTVTEDQLKAIVMEWGFISISKDLWRLV